MAPGVQAKILYSKPKQSYVISPRPEYGWSTESGN